MWYFMYDVMNQGTGNGGYAPLYITVVLNYILHNCMLDIGASTNVMNLQVMN